MAQINYEDEDMPDFGGQQQEQPKAVTEESLKKPEKKEYAVSDSIRSRLDRMDKAKLKADLGIDIDYLIGHTKHYGVLEPLAMGDFTPPIHLRVNGQNMLATVRVTTDLKDPHEMNYETHPVGRRYALDGEGRQKFYEDGNPVVEYDVNPIKQGDMVMFNGRPLSREQTDQLRLTGSVEGPFRSGFTENGSKWVMLATVDRYNNHELCTVFDRTVRNRLLPSVQAELPGGEMCRVRSAGCVEKDGRVYVNVSVYDRKGSQIRNADGSDISIPVHCDEKGVNVVLDNGSTLTLDGRQVARLAPTFNYTVRKDDREVPVMSYLTMKQIANMSEGYGVWAGPETAKDGSTKNNMTFIVGSDGKGRTLSRVPAGEKGYATFIKYDVYSGRASRAVSYDYAKKQEVRKAAEQSHGEAMQKSRVQTASQDMAVGQHV